MLWITEEALKCEGLAAVVAEAVESSGVTGFILRKDGNKTAGTVATARCNISALPSHTEKACLAFPLYPVQPSFKNAKKGSFGDVLF